MFQTPPSPVLLVTEVQLYVLAGGGIVVGLAVLLAGFKLARVLTMLVGAGVGFAIAGPLAERIGARLDVTRGVMVFCMATVGLVTARITWAAIAAVAVTAVAAGVLIGLFLPAAIQSPESAAQAGDNAGLWCWEHAQHLQSTVLGALGGNVLPWALGAGLVAGVVLFAGLMWPKPTQVILTALTGAALLLAGSVLLAAKLKPDLWERTFQSGWYVLMGLGGLFLVGLIVQARQAVHAAKPRGAARRR